MILSISENTVKFPSENMQKKINAPNKNPGGLLRGRYWLNLIAFLSACQMQKPAERHALSRFYITDGRLV
ncbi:DNA-binding transcriptional activator SdiA [Escherichia coli]|uniref:DNA-binding transcriptional activator SdiA n=1 Tax=Escherichia coli TaxID=562 RepID=A0A376KS11_ECOLX|nr:DNA-binding transcriptional activator SdiA [Escherichia coli]